MGLHKAFESQNAKAAPGRNGESEEKESYRDFWPVAGFEVIDTSSSCRINFVLLENIHQRLLAQDVRIFSQARLGVLQKVEAYVIGDLAWQTYIFYISFTSCFPPHFFPIANIEVSICKPRDCLVGLCACNC